MIFSSNSRGEFCFGERDFAFLIFFLVTGGKPLFSVFGHSGLIAPTVITTSLFSIFF